MENAIVVQGTIKKSKYIVLDELLTNMHGKVEVIIRPLKREKYVSDNFKNFFLSLPPGNRAKSEIDNQIAEERNSWD